MKRKAFKKPFLWLVLAFAFSGATLFAQSDNTLFNHADGSFWRRHFTIRFTPTGGDVIVWVFDAAGTRARTWRGSVLRVQGQGRGPT